MAVRFTTWVSTVLAQLSGTDVDAGDRIAIYDAGAGTTKYLDPTEIADIPEVASAIDVVGEALTAHQNDAADAHDASAISVVDVGGYFTGTDVEAALQEVGALAAPTGVAETARDAVGAALVAGEAIDITVSDGSDTITIDAEDATTTNKGVAELATDAEAIAKSSTAVVVTPSNLAAIGSTSTFAGLVELATDAEAITGTDTARATTPANVKAAASSGTLTDAGSLITATTIEGGLQEIFNGSFAVNTNATTGATETLTLAPAHKMTMDQSCVFTFPTPATNGHTFQLWLLGAFTPTFPASVDWHGSAAPTYVNDSLYGFTTLDGGTNWLGALVASNLG